MTTPSQTVGPYLPIGLPWPDGPDVVPEGTTGRIRLYGKVLDGDGDVVPDALIETWQADADGSFDNRDFRGFGRAPTNDDGDWEIFTVRPGAIGDGQAPHIDVNVFARGMLNRVVTRIYFADEDNSGDPVLATRPAGAPRRRCSRSPTADGYRFDVVLQGERETVFFKL